MCEGERGERREGLRARHLRGAGERRDGLIARHVSARFSQGFALHNYFSQGARSALTSRARFRALFPRLAAASKETLDYLNVGPQLRPPSQAQGCPGLFLRSEK